MKEYICVESPNEVDGGLLVRKQELIRCKDCLWYEYDKKLHCGFGGHGVRMDDDYCSDAKPKEKS